STIKTVSQFVIPESSHVCRAKTNSTKRNCLVDGNITFVCYSVDGVCPFLKQSLIVFAGYLRSYRRETV
ncbi:hypothetical protein Q8G50_33615, partial [Klebsiella pneumoniae]